MRFLRYAIAALAIAMALGSPAKAAGQSPASIYNTIADVNCATVLGDNGCASQPNIAVQGVTLGAATLQGQYQWSSTCNGGATPDGTIFFRPTGATTGCFLLKGWGGGTATVQTIAQAQALAASGVFQDVIVTGTQGAGMTFEKVACGGAGQPSCTADGGTTFSISGDVSHVLQRAAVSGQSDFNASWFNSCTGSSDQSAFQALLTAAGATKVAEVPAGCTVALSAMPTLISGQTIKGPGTISCLNCTNAVLFDETGLSNVSITGLTINFTGSAAQTNYYQTVFLLNTTTGAIIRDNKITTTDRTAIGFSGIGVAASTGFDIADNTIVANGTTTYTFGIIAANRTDVGTITTAGNQGVIDGNDIQAHVTDILYDGDNTKITNNYLHDSTVGLATEKVKNLIVSDNHSMNNGGQGLAIGNGTDDLATGVTLTGNVSCGNYQGINIYQQPAGSNQGLDSGISIVGNVTCNNTVNGIFAYSNGHATISGNSTYGNGGYGILVSAVTPNIVSGHVTVTGNLVRNNNGGISAGGYSGAPATGITISNNEVSGSAGDGIYVASATAPTITGNQVSSSGTYGLHLANNTNASIFANTFTGSTTDDFFMGGGDSGDILVGNYIGTSNKAANNSAILSAGVVSMFANTGLYVGQVIINAGGQPANVLGAGGTWTGNASLPNFGGAGGATCSGTPTASYAVTAGVVTHC